MLDAQNRLVIGKELIERANFKLREKLNIYYEPEEKRLLLKRLNEDVGEKYFVSTQLLEVKTRVAIPLSIRNAFPNAKYLPVEKDGEIYILII